MNIFFEGFFKSQELVDFAIVVGGHKVHRELQIEDEFGLRENPAFRFKEEAVKEIFI